jgi:uncharacterized protein (DUF488 family)
VVTLALWTVGHSTRGADEFLELLRVHRIEGIADVRRFPASRRHPHFSREPLEPALAEQQIGYHWLPALGGRRSPRPDSTNTGWRVAAFRGYADYMETPEFAQAFAELLDVAQSRRTAIMCAESLWWQCHRRLIADQLLAVGHHVVHILSRDDASPHKLIPPASIRDGKLSYAAPQPELQL